MPKRDITAGFEPIMPSYAGILDDGEIQSLTAYIRSLSTAEEKAMTDALLAANFRFRRGLTTFGAGHDAVRPG